MNIAIALVFICIIFTIIGDNIKIKQRYKDCVFYSLLVITLAVTLCVGIGA